MFGVVQEMNPSRSGNSQRLKLMGKWYVANSRVNLDGVSKGARVEYETSSFPGNDGQMIASIARIRPAPGSAPNNAPNSAGSPQTGSTIADGDILRSVSNIVGNAAAAGKIPTPGEIDDWVDCAYTALMNMGKAQASGTGGQASPGSAPREPGQDDDPGFGDDLEKMPPW